MSLPSTPLLRPDRYFRERGTHPGRGLAVGLCILLGVVVGVYAIGWVFAAHIDGTVVVDNPDRPPETFCDGDGFDPAVSGCDEPRQIERNIDHFVWQATGSLAGQMAIGMPIVLLLVAGALHAGTWLANGEGSFGRTLAVASWGMLPTLAASAAAIVALWLTFDPITVDGGDPTVLRDQAIAQLDTMRLVGGVAGVATMAWGALVWRYGLVHARHVSGAAASATATVVAVLVLGLGMA